MAAPRHRSKSYQARKRREAYQPLDNERHEMFVRCVAAGNDVLVCYYGVGYEKDRRAAVALANLPIIREQVETYHGILNPTASKPFEHPE